MIIENLSNSKKYIIKVFSEPDKSNTSLMVEINKNEIVCIPSFIIGIHKMPKYFYIGFTFAFLCFYFYFGFRFKKLIIKK